VTAVFDAGSARLAAHAVISGMRAVNVVQSYSDIGGHVDALGHLRRQRDCGQRFGWRRFILVNGRLLAPVTMIMWPHPGAVTECRHGRAIPSPLCACGIHYSPNV
jgi:hypothetical protein